MVYGIANAGNKVFNDHNVQNGRIMTKATIKRIANKYFITTP
jgi:hypothetical protein